MHTTNCITLHLSYCDIALPCFVPALKKIQLLSRLSADTLPSDNGEQMADKDIGSVGKPG